MKRSKRQENKPWTDKQTNIIADVLSSTESRDKPFALVLETMALTKTATYFDASELLNWKLLLRFFEPKRQFEIRPAYFGNTRNSQARSGFCWLGNHAILKMERALGMSMENNCFLFCFADC